VPHEGQRLGEPLPYAPLPAEVVAAVEKKLRTLRAGDDLALEANFSR